MRIPFIAGVLMFSTSHVLNAVVQGPSVRKPQGAIPSIATRQEPIKITPVRVLTLNARIPHKNVQKPFAIPIPVPAEPSIEKLKAMKILLVTPYVIASMKNKAAKAYTISGYAFSQLVLAKLYLRYCQIRIEPKPETIDVVVMITAHCVAELEISLIICGVK
jgi:hypothetical protein